MRAFYDGFNQVDSIFCFKTVIFTKKIPINSTALSFLGASDKAIHSLSLVVARYHSLSFDVPLISLFLNDRSIDTKKTFAN